MPPALSTTARIAGHIGFGLVAILGAAWSAAAMGYQLDTPFVWLGWGALILALAAALWARRRSRLRGWAVVAIAALAVAGWYVPIRPQQNLNWWPEMARTATYTRDGDRITVQDVRAFDWTSETQATERWETRHFDMSQLSSADMVISVWDSPRIAHLIVTFGFDDGQHLAFSVETRKERDEGYSTFGGFFKRYELVLIVSDEADVIRLRTDMRKEDVHLYPLKLDADQRQRLFLGYLDYANRLAATPQFYHTVTANCASAVYPLAKAIDPAMPLDLRLLLSGGLPEYIDELGGLAGDMPMDERRARAAITARAQALPPGADYSAGIRAGG